jgi:hypothetical protein
VRKSDHLQVKDLIVGLGGLELPWEGQRLTPEDRRKLGVFKSSLMPLLDRNPAKRPAMATFCETCNRVLAGSTSVQV